MVAPVSQALNYLKELQTLEVKPLMVAPNLIEYTS